MKGGTRAAGGLLAAAIAGVVAVTGHPAPAQDAARAAALRLPYREMGISDREAAAHVLSRLSFGARPGEVDRVAAEGVERWLQRQLAPAPLPEPRLQSVLAAFPSLALTPREIAVTYVSRGQARAGARAAGTLASDSPGTPAQLEAFMRTAGLRPRRQLMDELYGQKVARAVYAENTLREVLTDFWANHFFVGVSDARARHHLLAYERDAIRPNALGPFPALLLAATAHPAMLEYLDNAQSTAAAGMAAPRPRGQGERRRLRGVNENLARELLELHTLGVDGGYTQADVVALARILTGWGVASARPDAGDAERDPAPDGLFAFHPELHDVGAKVLLGERFPAGGGYDEGVRALRLLAGHPSTARHVAGKLAARFVADAPPPALVDRLARRFTETGGDVRAVMVALVQSPEFWSEDARAAKVKSPLELAASGVRALGADVGDARALVREIAEMGQPLYGYNAPSGFPDRAEHWLAGGTLVSRINFGMRLASGQVRGVRVDLRALPGAPPPSAAGPAALDAYAALLLAGREAGAVTPGLRALALDPNAAQAAASPAARMVGALLGSPAFQRR